MTNTDTLAKLVKEAHDALDRKIENEENYGERLWTNADSSRRYMETLKSITIEVRGNAVIARATAHPKTWGYVAADILDSAYGHMVGLENFINGDRAHILDAPHYGYRLVVDCKCDQH